MEEFLPVALIRQRRMKFVARVLFALSVLAVVTPLVVSLLGYNTDLPIVLTAASLLTTGIIFQTRSDPVYARTPQDGE